MESKKLVLIVNGKPRAGKDTFAQILNTFVPVYKYSIIDRVKTIAMDCGWRGQKTEKDRKFLHDLKKLTDEYSSMAFQDVLERVAAFDDGLITKEVMVIDVRDPEEIEELADTIGALTVFIQNDNVPDVTSNPADANVANYEYDFILENNGSLEDFEFTVYSFLNVLMALSQSILCQNEDEDDEEEDEE